MNIKNILLLFLTAAIWGVAFVAQSMGMEHVGPFTFSCARFFLGGLVLLPFVWYSGKKKGNTMVIPGHRKTLLIGGLSCGIALCLATNFQQIGIQYTTVGKAGFITACYIVIVPVMGLLLGKKCSPMVAGAVVLSLGGLYLLCMAGGELAMNRGDLLMLVCALLFSAHIMIIDFFSPVVGQNVLYPVFCQRCFVGGSHVSMGKAGYGAASYGLGSCSLCGCPVLRCGLYPADHRSEGHESYGGLSDPEPGIQHFRAGRLGDPGTEAYVQRALGMRPDVWSHYPGPTAESRRKKGKKGENIRLLFICNSVKMIGEMK